MYGLVLATVLAGSSAPPANDGNIQEAIEDLKDDLRDLKKAQTEERIDDLKQRIDSLRQEKLEHLLREILWGLHAHHYPHDGYHYPYYDYRYPYDGRYRFGPPAASLPGPMPRASAGSNRATVIVHAPPGSRLYVQDREYPLTPGDSAFVTPPLTPGKDYRYDFRVSTPGPGNPEPQNHRVGVHANEVVHVNVGGGPGRLPLTPPPPPETKPLVPREAVEPPLRDKDE